MDGKFFVLAGLLLCAFGATAEIQKWVDEQGVTHYGEKPPQGARTQRINTSGGNVIETSPNRQRIRQMNDTFDAKRALDKKRQQEKQKAAKENRKLCRQAKSQLNIMQQQVRVFYMDGDKRQYVDDQQREKDIKTLQEQVDRYCQ